MMIYGDGVLVKYGVIIEGRSHELMAGACTPQQFEARSDQLMEFRNQLRTCKPSEFDEWYELYKDFKAPGNRRR